MDVAGFEPATSPNHAPDAYAKGARYHCAKRPVFITLKATVDVDTIMLDMLDVWAVSISKEHQSAGAHLEL